MLPDKAKCVCGYVTLPFVGGYVLQPKPCTCPAEVDAKSRKERES